MKTQEITVRRLALIKYLFTQGVEQSRQPEPQCALSLLMLHDAIELFLHLATQVLEVSKGDIRFMDYWDTIDQKLEDGHLSYKEAMRRVNKARVSLKHYGNLPSRQDLEDFRVSALGFFEQNTPKLFEFQFSEISLVALVESRPTRKELELACEHLQEQDFQGAFSALSVAYQKLIRDVAQPAAGELDFSRVFTGNSVHSIRFGDGGTFSAIAPRKGTAKPDQRTLDSLQKLKDAVEVLQDGVRILALGIEPKRYSRFLSIVPIATLYSGSDQPSVQWPASHTPDLFTRDNFDFCLNFVIDTALQLQQRDP